MPAASPSASAADFLCRLYSGCLCYVKFNVGSFRGKAVSVSILSDSRRLRKSSSPGVFLHVLRFSFLFEKQHVSSSQLQI